MAEFYFFGGFANEDAYVFDYCPRLVILPFYFDRKMVALSRSIFHLGSLYIPYEFRFLLISCIWIVLTKNFIHAFGVRFRFIVV